MPVVLAPTRSLLKVESDEVDIKTFKNIDETQEETKQSDPKT